MPTEIEVKLRLERPEALRERLTRLGADCLGTVRESNWILDAADGSLRSQGCALRVRSEHPQAAAGHPRVTLTYKGPRRQDSAARDLKIREEIETVATDEAALLAILSRLGFHPVLSYEKRRETWRLADCLVMLDELPILGWFTEIEGPGPSAVQEVQARIGLDSAAAETDTYPDLTRRHGQTMPDGTRALRFPG